jgi:hypothetical protein
MAEIKSIFETMRFFNNLEGENQDKIFLEQVFTNKNPCYRSFLGINAESSKFLDRYQVLDARIIKAIARSAAKLADLGFYLTNLSQKNTARSYPTLYQN